MKHEDFPRQKITEEAGMVAVIPALWEAEAGGS